eukprot:1152881-Pelagomonas_calceolata.AAC.5
MTARPERGQWIDCKILSIPLGLLFLYAGWVVDAGSALPALSSRCYGQRRIPRQSTHAFDHPVYLVLSMVQSATCARAGGHFCSSQLARTKSEAALALLRPRKLLILDPS